jgi:hypothetical protein
MKKLFVALMTLLFLSATGLVVAQYRYTTPGFDTPVPPGTQTPDATLTPVVVTYGLAPTIVSTPPANHHHHKKHVVIIVVATPNPAPIK